DSGTNNFGQSMILNPELQFSGNNEVATVKLDIFGEVVVTLGTVPQGQGHETTSAQVVAEILGCTPDDVNVRAGHDTYWNSTAGLTPDLGITLNVRHVYRRQFEKPDLERKFGNLTLTYATQIHACAVEIDPETGVYEIVDYAAVDDCGNRIHPQIVEGQVHGAT